MKIYNKKVFASGVFMGGLGVLNLIILLIHSEGEIIGFLVPFLLLLFGISAVMRSLSKRLTKEDKLMEMDERNQLIELKSKSRAFRVTQIISFLLMLTLIVMGKVSGEESFLTIGLGMAFACGISMYTEIFTYMYYESNL